MDAIFLKCLFDKFHSFSSHGKKCYNQSMAFTIFFNTTEHLKNQFNEI